MIIKSFNDLLKLVLLNIFDSQGVPLINIKFVSILKPNICMFSIPLFYGFAQNGMYLTLVMVSSLGLKHSP